MLEWIQDNYLLAGLILVLVLLVITMIIVFIIGKKKESSSSQISQSTKTTNQVPVNKVAATEPVEAEDVEDKQEKETTTPDVVVTEEKVVETPAQSVREEKVVVKEEKPKTTKAPAKKPAAKTASKPAAKTASKPVAKAATPAAKKEVGAAKYHVSQNKDDDSEFAKMWRVRKEGSQKTIKYFKTQKEAIEYAESLAESAGSSVVIHKMDGSIRKQNYQK